jgi:phenylpyruvate tautomerase PptA (4-oxalocrotonate tautomerase family)
MDTYGASFSVIVVAISEMVFLMWLYGANRSDIFFFL